LKWHRPVAPIFPTEDKTQLMQLRAIALDLDGTLLNSQMQIWPENVAALQAARARGVEVVLVTGRHHIATRAYHHQLGLDSPAVCCNGIYVHDFQRNTPLHGEPLSVAERLALLAHVRRQGLHALAYLDEHFCYERSEPVLARVMAWAASLPEAVRPRFEQVADLAPVLAQAPRVWKLAISHHHPEALPALAQTLEAELGLGTVQTGPLRLDVGRPGHSKASGLAFWLAQRGLLPEQVLAFGDNYNDISMLRSVGHGVAMAEAPPAVQAAAHEVCGSHERASIAEVLQRLQQQGRLA
jgi:Cof subfamily protein (haloacid dehalogenase superfamily)